MKFALAVALFGCCLLEASVAFALQPYGRENIYAYRSSMGSPMERMRYNAMLQNARPTSSSSMIFEANGQTDDEPNFTYESIDEDGISASCGCYLIGTSGGRKEKRDVDNHEAAKAYIQTISIPYQFYEVDQYGQLSVCKCAAIPPGEENQDLIDFAKAHGY